MKTDDDLNQLFRSATTDLDLAVDRVITGGTERGRRLRRRQNLTRTIGAVAAVAVIAPLAWVGVASLGSHSDSLEAATQTSGDTATLSDAIVVPAFVEDGLVAELSAVLTELFPEATVAKATWGNEVSDRRRARADVVLTDPDGRTGVTLEVFPNTDDADLADVVQTVCANPLHEPGDPEATCVERNGGHLAPLTVEEKDGVITYSATFLTPDAVEVRASSVNVIFPFNEGDGPVRATPLVSLDAISELVMDPRWTTVAERPEPKPQKPLRGASVEGEAIGDLFAELVAEVAPDVRIVEQRDLTGHGVTGAALVLEDGEGLSYTDLYLTEAGPSFNYEQMLIKSDACGKGCTEDENGQLIVRARVSPEFAARAGHPGSWNSAGYQRADGVSVVVTSGDTAESWATSEEKSRTFPLLGVTQLAQIATSERWLEQPSPDVIRIPRSDLGFL